MQARISRRKLADHAVRELRAGNSDVLKSIAAYIVTSRRQREVELIVRDIEAALEEDGVLLARLVSARELSSQLKKHISEFLKKETKAESVSLIETVDESVLGGVKITTPTATYDNTIKHNINALRALKQ